MLGQGYVADSGFELAIVHLNVKRVLDGATLSLDNPLLFDDKGQSYQSVYSHVPLGNEVNESREFIFPIKRGIGLKRIQLAPDITFNLP